MDIEFELSVQKPTWERDHIAAGRNETVECGEDGSRRKIEKLDVELVKRVEQVEFEHQTKISE
jgi:hypothetical protein